MNCGRRSLHRLYFSRLSVPPYSCKLQNTCCSFGEISSLFEACGPRFLLQNLRKSHFKNWWCKNRSVRADRRHQFEWRWSTYPLNQTKSSSLLPKGGEWNWGNMQFINSIVIHWFESFDQSSIRIGIAFRKVRRTMRPWNKWSNLFSDHLLTRVHVSPFNWGRKVYLTRNCGLSNSVPLQASISPHLW